MLTVSTANPQPLYQQVVDQIRAHILSGDLAPGAPLPSVRQLAAEISASVITTRRAYLELEKEGLIVTRPGLGTFVAPVTAQERKRMALRMLEAELRDLAERAATVGVTPGELAELLRGIMSARGEGEPPGG